MFPGIERQLGLLRQWLKALIPDHPVLDDVTIVATELASNAIKHTASGRGWWFAVEITCYGDFVRVSVADCGARGEPRVVDDPLAEEGRGLIVVTRLAMRTGVQGDHEGRVVWADIACEDRLYSQHWPPGSLPHSSLYGPSFRQLIGVLGHIRG